MTEKGEEMLAVTPRLTEGALADCLESLSCEVLTDSDATLSRLACVSLLEGKGDGGGRRRD